MTLIDGTTAPRLQSLSDPSDLPVRDLLAMFGSEFFVEWQVADHASVAEPPKPQEK